jgi:hypothetical protein
MPAARSFRRAIGSRLPVTSDWRTSSRGGGAVGDRCLAYFPSLGPPPQHLRHVRRDAVAQVRRNAVGIFLDRGGAQVAQALVDAFGADAGERQDRARDGEVRAPGGLDAPLGYGDAVDALDRRVDRLGVLEARLQQQRPVDVPEQQRHISQGKAQNR